jgi:hypothetical protein
VYVIAQDLLAPLGPLPVGHQRRLIRLYLCRDWGAFRPAPLEGMGHYGPIYGPFRPMRRLVGQSIRSISAPTSRTTQAAAAL